MGVANCVYYHAHYTNMSAAKIDLQGVRREFVHALDAERKYERENDAKFRAVNQRVATYEEFR